MNKLFTKIATAFVGIAMAIGVGVAVGSHSDVRTEAASKTVKYAQTGTSAASVSSGTAPTGSAITFRTTYTDKNQLTNTNSMTYTISGYAGYKITAITLSMKSNKSSGSGTFSAVAGTTTLASISSNTAFSNWYDSAGFTQSYTDIHVTMTNSSYSIGSGENLVITISVPSGKSNNSLYCQSVELTYDTVTSASLDIDVSRKLDYVGSAGFELNATATGYTPSSWTWTSSTAGIVSIDYEAGYAIVTPEGAGKTTITVSAPNGSTSMTKTCDVTVTSASGADSSHSLTIDDAILIANYTGETATATSYYMEGVVDSLYNSKYPMLQGTSDDLEIYKDCSKTVYAGDTIRVYGPILSYKSTQPEFSASSTVTVINVPVDSVSASLSKQIATSVTGGDLSDYLSVTVNGTNSRAATNTGWKVTNSSDTSVISVESDGKTFTSSSSVGTTTLTIASVADNTKTTTLEVKLYDASIPVLQSVTVSGTPLKATQYVGQTFDWTDLTFTPVYSPVKEPVESITGADIDWNDLVAGKNPTGSYTGDNDVSVTVTVTSVTVEADGVYAVYVSGDMSTKTYDENASWNYAGLVVKVTYKSDHETQVTPKSAITWSASATPKQLGVGTSKSVNVTATVDEVLSAAYPVSGITVTEHQKDKYGLYSGDLVEGDYVIVYDGAAMNTTVSGDRLQYIEPTISDNVIEDPDSSIVWHISASGDYWTLYNAAAEAYAAGTGVKNKAQMLADGTDNKSMWSVSGTSTYEFVNKANKAASVNANLRENGTFGFACYATSTGGPLSLYKLNYLPKAWASFNYVDGTPSRTSYMVGEAFDPAGLEIHAVYTEPSIYPEEDITDDIVWDALVEGTQATGTWDGHTVTITGLTITSFTPATYTKLTSLDQLAVGSEVIIGGYKSSDTAYYVLNGFSSSYFTATTTTATSSTMNTTSDTLIFTVEADKNGYYFKHGSNYIKRSSTNSDFGEKDSDACWTISFGDEGAVTMTNGSSGNTQFQFNDSAPRFKNYSGTQKNISIYVKSVASETDVLRTYVSRYLLLDNETLNQIPSTETGVGGTDCLGESGPYMTAKSALNSGEFSTHKANFQSSNDSIVANARLRYEAWARAYGDTTPYATTVHNSSFIALISSKSTNTSIIVIVTVGIAAIAIGGYFLLRKKKED